MVNYSNGKVYKIEPICDHDEGDVYIGSTTKQYLSQRMDTHRKGFRNWKSGKANHVTAYNLFQKYGIENCNIVLVECVNANNKDELEAKESHYIQTYKCVNKVIPMRYGLQGRKDRTYYRQQHYVHNKEKTIQVNKDYRDKNKVKLTQWCKEYHEAHKTYFAEKSKEYRENNKELISERQKENYLQNKDTITQRHREYYNNNKEHINRQMHCCICDSSTTHAKMKRHERTQKHQNNLNRFDYEFEYHWDDGTLCSEQDYYDSLI